MHGSPFNIDVIVDAALGTEGGLEDDRESYEFSADEEDMGAWEEAAEHDGGEN